MKLMHYLCRFADAVQMYLLTHKFTQHMSYPCSSYQLLLKESIGDPR